MSSFRITFVPTDSPKEETTHIERLAHKLSQINENLRINYLSYQLDYCYFYAPIALVTNITSEELSIILIKMGTDIVKVEDHSGNL